MKHKIMCLIIVISNSGCSSQKHSLYVESQSFGIVVSETKYATEVGKKILEDGGNAIDASVGVGFALAVTYPEAGNLGGGGFMVLRLKDGSRTSIDNYLKKATFLPAYPEVGPGCSLLSKNMGQCQSSKFLSRHTN